MAATGQPNVLDEIRAILERHLSKTNSQLVIRHALTRAGLGAADVERQGTTPKLIDLLAQGAALFMLPGDRDRCTAELRAKGGDRHHAIVKAQTVPIASEYDVVTARTAAMVMAAALDFSHVNQVKVGTAVSELARNIQRYAGSGQIKLEPVGAPHRALIIRAEDSGPGIADIDRILAGTYESKSGMGLGLLGCKRMLSDFSVDTAPGRGTRVYGRMSAG